MASVELSDAEWQQVLTIIMYHTNPLMAKISEQLRVQQEEKMRQAAAVRSKSNSAAHNEGSEF